jgi:hypothetical protein
MYQLTMLAVPHLISSRGNIVNVSSVNGIRPVSLIFSSTDGVGCKPTNLKEEGIFKELVCVAPLKNEKQLLKIFNNFFHISSLLMFWRITCRKLPSTNLLSVLLWVSHNYEYLVSQNV